MTDLVHWPEAIDPAGKGYTRRMALHLNFGEDGGAALRASCIDAREELREMGGGCSRAVAAEAERDAFAALLRKAREFIDTTRDPPYPAGADLADRIDAALAAREPT